MGSVSWGYEAGTGHEQMTVCLDKGGFHGSLLGIAGIKAHSGSGPVTVVFFAPENVSSYTVGQVLQKLRDAGHFESSISDARTGAYVV